MPTIRHVKALLGLGEMNPYGYKATFDPRCPNKIERLSGGITSWHYGLDLGPIVIMIENFGIGLLWQLMRRWRRFVSLSISADTVYAHRRMHAHRSCSRGHTHVPKRLCVVASADGRHGDRSRIPRLDAPGNSPAPRTSKPPSRRTGLRVVRNRAMFNSVIIVMVAKYAYTLKMPLSEILPSGAHGGTRVDPRRTAGYFYPARALSALDRGPESGQGSPVPMFSLFVSNSAQPGSLKSGTFPSSI